MRRGTGLIALLILCTGVTGCGKKADQRGDNAAADSAAVASTPRSGGTVIRRLDSECKTLNWVLYTTAYEKFILRHIYDPLIDYDQNGNLVPVLAAALPEVSDDHLRITLKLRPDAHWQDGVPITAKDVKFTLNKIPCNTYDIKVVDEDGDECIITGEKFCGNAATWDLTDEELLSCQGYGDE